MEHQTKAKVVIHRRDENVSFIAEGDMGPVRVITRPTDDVFEGKDGYEESVVERFDAYGISVSVKDIKDALKQ